MGDTTVEVAGRSVRVSSPDKVMFPRQGWTKLQVVEHFLGVADGVVRAVADRPCHLKRWPRGVGGEAFYQRRTKPSPDVEVMELRFHAATPGTVWVARTAADVVRMAQLNCIDLHPWPVRADDQDHPDELRLDLDPTPGTSFEDVRSVALVVREILLEDGLTPFVKTSGSRGLHVYARLRPEEGFVAVRRAALAVAREAERRHPAATSAWWKEQREGVFLDFNQLARDKTVAAAYSVRQTGFVSAPVTWEELPDVEIPDFPMAGYAQGRYADVGDLWAALDETAGSLDATLERVAADEAAGLGDAPWPPHYRKQAGEPLRAPPSRRRAPQGPAD